MPPHLKPGDNIYPLHRGGVVDRLADYPQPPRFVRPMSPEEIAQAVGDPQMLEALASRAEADSRRAHYEEQVRLMRLQHRIGVACIVGSIAIAAYFAGELLRPVVEQVL